MLQPSCVRRRRTVPAPPALPEALNSRTGWPMVSIFLFGTVRLASRVTCETGLTRCAGTGFAAAGWTGAINAGTALTDAAIASAILVTGMPRETEIVVGFGGTAADATFTGAILA